MRKLIIFAVSVIFGAFVGTYFMNHTPATENRKQYTIKRLRTAYINGILSEYYYNRYMEKICGIQFFLETNLEDVNNNISYLESQK